MTTNHDALREAFNAFLLEQHERHKHQHNHFHAARNEWARRTQSTQYEALAASKPEQASGEPGKGKELAEKLRMLAQHAIYAQTSKYNEAVNCGTVQYQELAAMIDYVCVGIDSPAAPLAAKPEPQAQAGEQP